MMGLSSTMAAAKCLRCKLPCHMQHFEKVAIQCVVKSLQAVQSECPSRFVGTHVWQSTGATQTAALTCR